MLLLIVWVMSKVGMVPTIACHSECGMHNSFQNSFRCWRAAMVCKISLYWKRRLLPLCLHSDVGSSTLLGYKIRGAGYGCGESLERFATLEHAPVFIFAALASIVSGAVL